MKDYIVDALPKMTFNEIPEEYDNLRPQYTDALYSDVIEFSSLDKTKNALEIGIGTGQATVPFLNTGCELTAIEIGDKLSKYTKEKFNEYNRLNVINQDFEAVSLIEGSYDLIYSATAFHWIPPEIGMPKVFRFLKNSGVFAWFSVMPTPSKEEIYNELQKVYAEYVHHFKGEKPDFDRHQEAQKTQQNRVNLFNEYRFTEITDRLYYDSRTLGAKDYAKLCSTYSDHIAIPKEDRMQLLQKIEDAINRHGGEITIIDTYLLCMGKKRKEDAPR